MLVSVAGLIGAGKSTLVSNLSSNNNYFTFMEPVDVNPFLVPYYNDPSRWSFTLQIYYLWERYKQSSEAFLHSLRGETVIIDSTIYSDMAFAMLQKKYGYFNEDEFNTYANMHHIIAAQTAYPDILFWLEISPNDTLERIKKRSRDCEASIPIEYLSDLYNSYSEVLLNLEKHTDIIRIDARKSAENVYLEVNSIIKDRLCSQSVFKYV